MRKLAKRFGIHHASVNTIINKFGEHYSLDELLGRGRNPGSSNTKLDQKVVSLIMKNKSMSIRDLTKKSRNECRNDPAYQEAKSPEDLQEAENLETKCRTEEASSNKGPEIVFASFAVSGCMPYVKEDSKTLPGPQYFTAVVGEDVSNADRSI